MKRFIFLFRRLCRSSSGTISRAQISRPSAACLVWSRSDGRQKKTLVANASFCTINPVAWS